MKQFIVLTASILLGVFLFNLIAGSGSDSVYSEVKTVWEKELEARKRTE